MNTSASRDRSRLSLTIAAIVLALTVVGQTQAAPILRLYGGSTSVQLSEDLVGALEALTITPGTIEPGALSEGMARFPISGGGIDQATVTGDLFHVGGLSLSNTDGTTVDLFNFIIDVLSEQPVLSGLVAVDGDLVGRLPLFNLSLANAQIEPALFSLTIQGAALSLTVEAADALNSALGTEAFMEGINVGTADVSGLF